MMLHKKSSNSHLLKLLALVPIVGITLAINAEKVQDIVYTPANNVPDAVTTATEQAPAVQEDTKTYTVRGVVKDKEKKDPIVGAVIRVNGSKKGTVTDRNGEFSLKAKKGDRIEVMYVGYASGSIVVNDPQIKYDLRLQKDGSDASNTNDKTFDVVEQMPEFPGGQIAMLDFLSKNIRYPEEAHKAGIQGRVVATFVVEKDGSISNAKVMRSIDPLLDAEALRVISSMPNWIPGKQDGKPVAVKYTIPVTFKLNSSEKKDESYILKIDGKVVDDSLISSIPAGDVESMSIEKGENGKPKTIHIKTKHKK